MFTENQIDSIAEKVAGSIDIPYVPEFLEVRAVAWAVERISVEVEEYLPAEFVALMQDAATGIERGTSVGMKGRLVDVINSKINIPFVGEDTERAIFDSVITIMCDAMEIDETLEKVLARG